MLLLVLGTSAGGGCPQWNCACPVCNETRSGRAGAPPRTQDSIAISKDGSSWHLINAGPDVRLQLEANAQLRPRDGVRSTPLRSVFLTDAELDHTLGLLILREGARLRIFAAQPVIDALSEHFPVKRMLASYTSHEWVAIVPNTPFELEQDLKITALPFGSKAPPYLKSPHSSHYSFAFKMEDSRSGGSAIYAPGIGSWTPEIETLMGSATVILADGTFSTEYELESLKISSKSAKEMGHLPLFGEDGLADKLCRFSGARKFLTHINNTNPVLLEHSSERQSLRELGIELAYDGMLLEI